MEDAVDNLVGRIQLHLNLARIGVDGKGLVLCECGRSQDDSDSENYEGFHAIPLGDFDRKRCYQHGSIQFANACGARVVGWVTRVSLAVTRIAPGQTLRQNGSTARATALFKPLAAASARRI